MRTEPKDGGQVVSESMSAAHELRHYLRSPTQDAVLDLHRAALGEDEEAFDLSCSHAKRLLRLRRGLTRLATAAAKGDGPKTYLVGVPFLRDVVRMLTRTRNEDLVYVTGLADPEGVYALTRVVRLDLDRGVAHATPIPKSAAHALLRLEEAGELLLATFHSQPGRGPRATEPSQLDLATQQRLERAEYPTIGAIVSRDGFIRFYSVDRPFRVAVSGTGYERVNDYLFQVHPCGFRPSHRWVRW